MLANVNCLSNRFLIIFIAWNSISPSKGFDLTHPSPSGKISSHQQQPVSVLFSSSSSASSEQPDNTCTGESSSMSKKILITGSTDGIGLEAAKRLVAKGHHVLIHGRSKSKVEKAKKALVEASATAQVEGFVADLSVLSNVEALAKDVLSKHDRLDVLINNAGVFKIGGGQNPVTADGLELRFAVNTIAPYHLTQRLLPLVIPPKKQDAAEKKDGGGGVVGRVVNLSSAAQSPVDVRIMADASDRRLSEFDAYAQSKLAITMWSAHMGSYLHKQNVAMTAVNPGSMLGTKMVQEGFGVAGGDIGIGADILCRAALADDFGLSAAGKYFDNDSGRFANPHRDASDKKKVASVVETIETILERLVSPAEK